jgi:hypothetical protein
VKDDALKKIAVGFREGILDGRPSAGFCLMICLPLWAFIRAHIKGSRLVEKDFYFQGEYGDPKTTNHFYIELPDGRILDPTADQFQRASGKFPKVYLGPMPVEYTSWTEAGELSRKAKVLAKKHGKRKGGSDGECPF